LITKKTRASLEATIVRERLGSQRDPRAASDEDGRTSAPASIKADSETQRLRIEDTLRKHAGKLALTL
jgi:hypothetical protein